jgi:hypothetical protein
MSVRLVPSSPILHAWAKTVRARAQTGQSGRQGQLEGKIRNATASPRTRPERMSTPGSRHCREQQASCGRA